MVGSGPLPEFVELGVRLAAAPFVSCARRIASFDRQAITAVKTQVNRSTLPSEENLLASFVESARSITGPGVEARGRAVGKLIARIGIDDLERNLGHHLESLAEQP